MPSNADIVAAARRCIGTRWRHQGRQPGLGLDCVGLVVCVGRDLGLLDFDTLAYQRHAVADGFIKFFHQYGREIPITRLHEGAVLAFREALYPCHCGIVASGERGPTLIHAYARRRCVVEEPLTMQWLSRIVAAFEYEGVARG